MSYSDYYWSQFAEEEQEETYLDILSEPGWGAAIEHGLMGTTVPVMKAHGESILRYGQAKLEKISTGTHAVGGQLIAGPPESSLKEREDLAYELSQQAYDRAHSLVQEKLNPNLDTFDPEFAAYHMAAQRAKITERGMFDSMVLKKVVTDFLPSMTVSYGGAAVAAIGGFLAGGPGGATAAALITAPLLTGLMEGGSEFAEAIEYNMSLGMDYREAADVAIKSAGAYALTAALLEGTLPAGKMFGAFARPVKATWFGKRLSIINKKAGKAYDSFGKTWYGKPIDAIIGQAAVESLEEFSQYAAQTWIQGQYRKDTFSERWDWEEAAMSAYGGLVMGGGMGSGGYSFGKVGQVGERLRHKAATPTEGQMDLLIKKNKETGFYELQKWDKENELIGTSEPFNTFSEAKDARENLIINLKKAFDERTKMEDAEVSSVQEEADGAPVDSSDSSDLQRSTQELLMLSWMGREADLSPEDQARLETHEKELALGNRTVNQEIKDLVEKSPQILESLGIPLEEFQVMAEEQGLDVPPETFTEPVALITPDQESEVTESDIPGPDVGVVASEDTEADQVPTSPDEPQQELKLEDAEDKPVKPATVKGKPPVSVTPKDVHTAAEAAGMKWDDDADFMALSKKITGKDRIDDMTSGERATLIDAIKAEEKLADAILGEEETLVETKTDKKGRTLTYFSKTKTEQYEGADFKTTTFTFNRSDKSKDQRNKAGVSVEKALGNKYQIDEGDVLEGDTVTKVFEIRDGKSGAAATVEFTTPDGKKYRGEVRLEKKEASTRKSKAKKSKLKPKTREEILGKMREKMDLPYSEDDLPVKGKRSIEAILKMMKTKFFPRGGMEYEMGHFGVKEEWGGRVFHQEDGTILIQINLDHAKPSDAFHEYAHPIFSLLRKENPKAFKALKKEFLTLGTEDNRWGQELLSLVKEHYFRELDKEDDFFEEAMVHALSWFASNEYMNRIKMKNRKQFVSWVTKVFNVMKDYINKMFKSPPLPGTMVSPHELKNITLYDVFEWLTDENITIDASPIYAADRGLNIIDDAAGIQSGENTSLSGPMNALIHMGRTLYKKNREAVTEEGKIESAAEILDFFRRTIFKPFAKDKKPRGGKHYRHYENDVNLIERDMASGMRSVLGPAATYSETLGGTFKSTDFIDTAVKEIVKNINEGTQPARVWIDFIAQLETLDMSYPIVEKLRKLDPNLKLDLKDLELLSGTKDNPTPAAELRVFREFVDTLLSDNWGDILLVKAGITKGKDDEKKDIPVYRKVNPMDSQYLAVLISLNNSLSIEEAYKYIKDFRDPSNTSKVIDAGILKSLYESWVEVKYGIKYFMINNQASGELEHGDMWGKYGADHIGFNKEDINYTKVHLMQDTLFRSHVRSQRGGFHAFTGRVKEGVDYAAPAPGMGYAWYVLFEKEGFSPVSVENQSDLWAELLQFFREHDYMEETGTPGLRGRTEEEFFAKIKAIALKRSAWSLRWKWEKTLGLPEYRIEQYIKDVPHALIPENISAELHNISHELRSKVDETRDFQLPRVDEQATRENLILDLITATLGTYNPETKKYDISDSRRRKEMEKFGRQLNSKMEESTVSLLDVIGDPTAKLIKTVAGVRNRQADRQSFVAFFRQQYGSYLTYAYTDQQIRDAIAKIRIPKDWLQIRGEFKEGKYAKDLHMQAGSFNSILDKANLELHSRPKLYKLLKREWRLPFGGGIRYKKDIKSETEFTVKGQAGSTMNQDGVNYGNIFFQESFRGVLAARVAEILESGTPALYTTPGTMGMALNNLQENDDLPHIFKSRLDIDSYFNGMNRLLGGYPGYGNMIHMDNLEKMIATLFFTDVMFGGKEHFENWGGTQLQEHIQPAQVMHASHKSVRNYSPFAFDSEFQEWSNPFKMKKYLMTKQGWEHYKSLKITGGRLVGTPQAFIVKERSATGKERKPGTLINPNNPILVDYTQMRHDNVFGDSEVLESSWDNLMKSAIQEDRAFATVGKLLKNVLTRRSSMAKEQVNIARGLRKFVKQGSRYLEVLEAHPDSGLAQAFLEEMIKYMKHFHERNEKYFVEEIGNMLLGRSRDAWIFEGEEAKVEKIEHPNRDVALKVIDHFMGGGQISDHWRTTLMHEMITTKEKGYNEMYMIGHDIVELMQKDPVPAVLYVTPTESVLKSTSNWVNFIYFRTPIPTDNPAKFFGQGIVDQFETHAMDLKGTEWWTDATSLSDFKKWLKELGNEYLVAAVTQDVSKLHIPMVENPSEIFSSEAAAAYKSWRKSDAAKGKYIPLGVKYKTLRKLVQGQVVKMREVYVKDVPILAPLHDSHPHARVILVDLTTLKTDKPFSRYSKLGIGEGRSKDPDGDVVELKSNRPPITPDDPDWGKWFNIIDSNYKRISKFLNKSYLSMELRLWIDQVTDRLPSHLLPVFNKWMQQPHISNILDPDNQIPEFVGAARHDSEVKALNVAEIEDVFDHISDDLMEMLEHETDEEVQVRKNSTFKIRKIAFKALGVTLTPKQMRDLIKSSQQHNEVAFLNEDVPRITHVTEPTDFQSRMMFRFWLAHNTQETVNQGQAGLQTRDNIIWLFDNETIQLKGEIDPLYLPGESRGKPNTNDSNPSRERSHLISRLYKKAEGGLKASLLFLKNKGILGKSDKSLLMGWENTRIFPRYKKYSAKDIKSLWSGELQRRKIVPLSVRGESGQIIFARVTPEHEKLKPIDYWREQYASGYITKDQANVMSSGTAFEKAANIARFEAINEIIPGFMVEEVDGVLQPASLLNIFKRVKIPFSPSVFNENMESMNVLILDAKKIKFKFKGEEHKKGIIKIKGLPDIYIADGASFASRSAFSKFVDGLGLSPKSNKMKNFIYQKDGDKVLAYKHETFPVEPGMQFFQGTKLVAKVNEKGDIIDTKGNVIDMISTDNEAKIMNGYEYNTPIVLTGGSVGLTSYADRPKQTSTFPLQWFNHVTDADIISLVKSEMVNKEKGPLIRRIREAFRITDSPARMAAFARKVDNTYPDGISSIVLEKLYLMSGVNPDNQIYNDTMIQKRQVAPAVGMKVGNGYYSHIYPNLRQDLGANEVALAYDDVKNTIIKQYQEDTNDDNPSIEKVNKWLKDKDIRVLASRSPITYIGGVNYARVARLHTFSGLVEASSEMVFGRQEGDHDGDAMQIEFLPEGLDESFKEYFDKIDKEVSPINIDEFRINERRYDFSSLDDVFDLMAGITAGGRAIQELAAMQAVYGVVGQVLKSITIRGVKIKPIPRNKVINLDHIKEGFKATPEDMLRIYVQAAVDVYNGLLLEKWEYNREELFVSLFETEDGTPLSEMKGSPLYAMAGEILLEAVYPMFRKSSYIKNGQTWGNKFKLSDVIERSQEYLDFVNNRQAGMSIALQEFPNAGAVEFNSGTALIEEIATLPARVYTAGHEREYHEDGPASVNHGVAENIHRDVLTEWSQTGFKAHLIDQAIEQSVELGELPMLNDPNYNAELMKQDTQAIAYVRKMANSWYALMFKFKSGLTDTVDYNEPMLNFIDEHYMPFESLSQVGKVLATLYFLESSAGITTTAGKRPKAANSKPPYSTTPGHPTMLDGNVMREFNILWHKYLYEDDSPPFGSEEAMNRERMSEKDADFTRYMDNGTIMRSFCR